MSFNWESLVYLPILFRENCSHTSATFAWKLGNLLSLKEVFVIQSLVWGLCAEVALRDPQKLPYLFIKIDRENFIESPTTPISVVSGMCS